MMRHRPRMFPASFVLAAALVPAIALADWNGPASMNGTEEFPSNPSPGKAVGTVQVINKSSASGTDSVRVNISFSGLQSNSTVAHIHGPAAPGANAGTFVTFSFTNGAPSGTISQTSSIDAVRRGYLLNGLAYLNIHTVGRPSGEIRGQIDSLVATDSLLILKEAEISIGGPATAAGNIIVKVVPRGADSTAAAIFQTTVAYDNLPGLAPTTAAEIRDAIVAGLISVQPVGYQVNSTGASNFEIRSYKAAKNPFFDVFVAVPHLKVIPVPGVGPHYGPINGVSATGIEKAKNFVPGASTLGLVLIALLLAGSAMILMRRRANATS